MSTTFFIIIPMCTDTYINISKPSNLEFSITSTSHWFAPASQGIERERCCVQQDVSIITE